MSGPWRAVAFPLDGLGHFRASRRLLAASAVLGVATWWLDVRASKLPFDRGALLVAVLSGVCLGAVLALALIVSWRACWCYRSARADDGQRYALSLDQEGVSLHLLGCDLSWAEIGWVRVEGRPASRRGRVLLGAAKTGPLSLNLQLRLLLTRSLAFGTRGVALKAWSTYGTPFAVDLRALAAERGAVQDAVRQFAPGHLRADGPDPRRRPLRRARSRANALWVNLQTGQVPAGGSPLADHSGFGWLFLLFTAALVIGIGGWAQATPFRDAWLLQHGLPATATVVKIITPCDAYRQVPEWEVSYTGRLGETEYASTTDIWGCPAVGQTVPIVFDPANPAYVGDVRVIRNRPFKLFLGAALTTFFLLFLNIAVQFWREPPLRK
jgi:hypothetical protein